MDAGGLCACGGQRPRWVRIFSMTATWSMKAMIRIDLPHCGHNHLPQVRPRVSSPGRGGERALASLLRDPRKLSPCLSVAILRRMLLTPEPDQLGGIEVSRSATSPTRGPIHKTA